MASTKLTQRTLDDILEVLNIDDYVRVTVRTKDGKLKVRLSRSSIQKLIGMTVRQARDFSPRSVGVQRNGGSK